MSQIDRRQALRLFAMLGVAGVAAGCGDTEGDEQTTENGKISDRALRIGLVGPQSGDLKPIGDEIVNGFKLYLEFNNGLLGGHTVETVIADEGESVKSGKAAVEKLLQQGVSALVGTSTSALLPEVIETVEKEKVPLLGTNGSPSELQGAIYHWSTSYVDDEPGEALGGYMAQALGPTIRVCIVAPRSAAGQDAVTGFQESFGSRGADDPRIASAVVWTPAESDPSAASLLPAINSIRQLNPGVIFCYAAGPAAVTFVKQLRAANLLQQLYAPGQFTEGTNIVDLGEQADGIFTAHNYAADLDNDANRRFADTYRRKFSLAPSASSVAAYDAAQVLDRAIRIAGPDPTSQEINIGIGKVGQIASPRGPWQFNQPRTPQQKWYLREVRFDGQVRANVLIRELNTLG